MPVCTASNAGGNELSVLSYRLLCPAGSQHWPDDLRGSGLRIPIIPAPHLCHLTTHQLYEETTELYCNQPIPSRPNVQQQLQKLWRWWLYARLNLCSCWEGSDIVWQEYTSTLDTNAAAVTISPALPAIWGNTWSQTQWAEELYWPKAPCHKLWSAPRAMLDMHQHTIKALGEHHS